MYVSFLILLFLINILLIRILHIDAYCIFPSMYEQ